MRLRLALVLLGGGLLLGSLVGVAAAVTPVKGATYKGSVGVSGLGDSVQFEVSANGKKVSGFTISFAPIGCQGVDPNVAVGGAKITAKGTFKMSLAMYFPPTLPSRHVGTLVVTGKFGKHKKESGTVKSVFTGADNFSTSCDKTDPYSTKG